MEFPEDKSWIEGDGNQDVISVDLSLGEGGLDDSDMINRTAPFRRALDWSRERDGMISWKEHQSKLDALRRQCGNQIRKEEAKFKSEKAVLTQRLDLYQSQIRDLQER